MSKFPQKVTISNNGVFIDDQEISGVTRAEIININPGTELMEVVLHIGVKEVDAQYRQITG